MQISGAGEGGRSAGREPARPAKAVAHEPFRVSDREAARTVRTPSREVDASRLRVEAKPTDPRTETRHADTRRADAASEARSRQERAEDAAGTAARRQDAIGRDRATKDKTTKDKTTKDAVADDRVRKTVAATTSAATAAKIFAVAPDAVQAEAAGATAADDETTEAASGDDVEGDAEATGTAPTLIPAVLTNPVATPPAAGAGLATKAASAESGAAPEAAAQADPKIAALLAEAAKAGGGKDQVPPGSPVPLPDGLAAPDLSAAAPQVRSADAAAPAAAETRPAVSVQAPLSAVPITIGMRALAGSNRFEIRLDPYELGRIDVSLDIARQHGTVKAHLVVERPETLALLQRDASSLQQALTQAGLDPGTTGLSFSLRDGGDHNPQRDQAGRPQGADRTAAPAEEAQAAAPLRNLGQRLGLDLRI